MLKILLVHFKSSIALDVSFLTKTIPIEPCSLRKLLTIGYCFLLSPKKIVMLRSIVLLTPFHHIVFFFSLFIFGKLVKHFLLHNCTK